MNKGLIFDIRRFTVHDGPGIRTTVFFKGCPMNCWWCHNPESQLPEPEESTRTIKLDGKKFEKKEVIGTWMTVPEVMDEILKDVVFYDESTGGVTLSGGEPLMQVTFLEELLKACLYQGIHTTLDTSGYALTDDFSRIIELPGLFLYDFKLMNDEDHLNYTGVSNQTIISNLLLLHDRRKRVVLRIPVIPGITDTKKNVTAMKSFLGKLNDHFQEINLLPYHSLAREKYRRLCKPDKMTGKKDVGKKNLGGLKKEFEEIGFLVRIGG